MTNATTAAVRASRPLLSEELYSASVRENDPDDRDERGISAHYRTVAAPEKRGEAVATLKRHGAAYFIASSQSRPAIRSRQVFTT
jgi:hypothetical protein